MRLIVLALVVGLTLAQADNVDPPSRVARISFLDGAVSMKPGGADDWVPAPLNRPMTTGEGLWADAGSRAELSLGNSALRISQQTGLSFLTLDDNTTQIRLDQGAVEITLRKLDANERFEVDTPNTAYLLKGPGEYRFDVNEDGRLTALIVRAGAVEAAGGGRTFTIDAPQMARVSGSDSIQYETSPAPPADDLSSWSSSREQRTEIADQVPPEVVGREDLDPHGWSTDAQYGLQWRPTNVAADWAPYTDGQWMSVAPWGWTWVDSSPWGFAPYHYGRWVMIRGSWAWIPGLMGPHPVYAPALVAWVGGPSLGPAVGWFPLGPHEAYVPGYRASPVYINRINGVSVYAPRVSAPNTYVNRGHLTLMRQDAFVNARPVRQGRLPVAPGLLVSARATNVLNIAPQRASVLGYVENPARVAHPPAALANRSVVVRSGMGTSRVGAARVRATAPVIQAMSKAEKTRLEQLRKQQLKQQLKQQQAQKKIDEQRRKQAAKAQRQRQRQLAKQQLRQAAKSAAKSSPAASSGSKK